ncbi:unnamed protein product [Fusarium graminearum]|nr:unnamed protein product [Fusarium graminearum]VTO84992.1 unnamed protein product [Fusarium graminearum]
MRDSYGDIYNALGTSVLDKEAYSQFVSVLETGRPIPHVLSLPEQASQPALAERARGSQVEADLPNELQLDDIFALPESFTPPFQTFSTSEALQKLIEEARESVNYQHPQEVLSTLLLEV